MKEQQVQIYAKHSLALFSFRISYKIILCYIFSMWL